MSKVPLTHHELLRHHFTTGEGTPLVLLDLTNEAYHDPRCTGYSKSDLLLARRSLAHLHARKSRSEPQEPTPSMLMGSAYHAAILEPDLFEKEWIARPAGMRAGSKAYDEWMANHAFGKTELSAEGFGNVLRVRDAVSRHGDVRSILDARGYVEPSYFWKEDFHGTVLKSRPDKAILSGVVVDFKSTEDARPAAFRYSIRDYGYDLQAVMQIDGFLGVHEIPAQHIMVAFEKQAPFGVYCYEMKPADIIDTRNRLHTIIESLAPSIASNEWPGYPPGIHTIELPPLRA